MYLFEYSSISFFRNTKLYSGDKCYQLTVSFFIIIAPKMFDHKNMVGESLEVALNRFFEMQIKRQLISNSNLKELYYKLDSIILKFRIHASFPTNRRLPLVTYSREQSFHNNWKINNNSKIPCATSPMISLAYYLDYLS